MRRILTLFLIVGLFLAVATSPTLADTTDAKAMEFDVFLDGKKIGYHRFEIDGSESDAAVRSEASFDVKFLFITAFKYRHVATESWTGGCLKAIEASTDSNGKQLQLFGERIETGFVVDNGAEEAQLPECVMTFAYWNPEFLEQARLLNPQTGEYLDVNVTELGDDVVEIGGRQVSARSVRLTARKMDITLWYSSDEQWLALESVAKGGRIIRYELV